MWNYCRDSHICPYMEVISNVSKKKSQHTHENEIIDSDFFLLIYFVVVIDLKWAWLGEFFLANSIFMFTSVWNYFVEKNKSFLSPQFLLPVHIYFFIQGKMQTRTSNVKVLSRFTFYPCMSSIFICSRRRAGEK